MIGQKKESRTEKSKGKRLGMPGGQDDRSVLRGECVMSLDNRIVFKRIKVYKMWNVNTTRVYEWREVPESHVVPKGRTLIKILLLLNEV